METTPPGSKGTTPSEYASAKSTLSPGMRGYEPSARGFTKADINLSSVELLARMNAHLAERKRDKGSSASRGGKANQLQRPPQQHHQPPQQQQQHQCHRKSISSITPAATAAAAPLKHGTATVRGPAGRPLRPGAVGGPKAERRPWETIEFKFDVRSDPGFAKLGSPKSIYPIPI